MFAYNNVCYALIYGRGLVYSSIDTASKRGGFSMSFSQAFSIILSMFFVALCIVNNGRLFVNNSGYLLITGIFYAFLGYVINNLCFLIFCFLLKANIYSLLFFWIFYIFHWAFNYPFNASHILHLFSCYDFLSSSLLIPAITI